MYESCKQHVVQTHYSTNVLQARSRIPNVFPIFTHLGTCTTNNYNPLSM